MLIFIFFTLYNANLVCGQDTLKFDASQLKKIEESHWEYLLYEVNKDTLIMQCLCYVRGGIWGIEFLLNDQEIADYFEGRNSYLKSLNNQICSDPYQVKGRLVEVNGSNRNNKTVNIETESEMLNYLADFPPNCETEKYWKWTITDSDFVHPLLETAGMLPQPNTSEIHFNWDDEKIDLNDNYYYNIPIMKLKGCNNLYFVVPVDNNYRIKLIRSEVIVKTDNK